MSGWLYLIRNRDLYKIGITRNLESRMRQLKPDHIVAKLYSREFRQLERELHKKYKNVRIPQTEYFRLNNIQVREIKNKFSEFYYPVNITFKLILNSFTLIIVLFSIIFLCIALNINDLNIVVFRSLQWMERLSFLLSFLALFIKSNNYYSIFNELKFRISRFSILFLFTFLFRIASKLLF